jgi:hypothetical protein
MAVNRINIPSGFFHGKPMTPPRTTPAVGGGSTRRLPGKLNEWLLVNNYYLIVKMG